MIMKLVTVLMPCFNEEQSLPLLYQTLNNVIDTITDYEFEYLFINDGSKDHTLDILRTLYEQDSRVCYVDLSRNFGKENAMLAGFDYAKGDAVIIMDADLQHPPTLIPEMLALWNNGEVQDVYAKRRVRGKESWMRKTLSLLYHKLLANATRFEILQNVGDFRLLDRQAIEALRKLRETERYTKGMYCWIGFQKKELLFDQQDRVAGDSKWNFSSLVNLAIEGVTSFTTAPLRIAGYVGIATALGSFLYALYYFVKTLIVGDPVAGFPTLIIVILFLGGIQLLALGILGEYVGRIFNEVKRRPVYLAKEYNGEKIMDIR
jgi:glycosyltransferase involved in cell wall biosynthesis